MTDSSAGQPRLESVTYCRCQSAIFVGHTDSTRPISRSYSGSFIEKKHAIFHITTACYRLQRRTTVELSIEPATTVAAQRSRLVAWEKVGVFAHQHPRGFFSHRPYSCRNGPPLRSPVSPIRSGRAPGFLLFYSSKKVKVGHLTYFRLLLFDLATRWDSARPEYSTRVCKVKEHQQADALHVSLPRHLSRGLTAAATCP